MVAEVTEEIKAQAEASAKKAAASKATETKGFAFGKSMRRKAANDPGLTASEIPVEMDPSNFGPTAFSANIDSDVTGYVDSQTYTLDEDRATVLWFTAPGQNLPKKNLYTVKAIHKDGRLVQLPFEEQIQNTAGGDIQDALGLRRYQSKGITVLFDFDEHRPVYCAAWDCWAKADIDGFCCPQHRAYTIPNADAGSMTGVTTSRVWNG